MKELDGTNQPSRADSHWKERARLHMLLASIRRRIFLQEFFDFSIRAALLAFPLGAVAIAVNQFFGPHVSSWQILWGSVLATLVFAALRAALELRERSEAALAFDAKADLRDRVSSALSFLRHQDKTSAPEKLQIADTVERVEAMNANRLFRIRLSGRVAWFALASLLLAASFFVSGPSPVKTQASVDDAKLLQIEELDHLEKELEEETAVDEEDSELQETLEKLRQLKEQFQKGELSDRDLMIELARLGDALQQQRQELGVQHLEEELNMIVPHLSASAETKQVAQAIQKNQLEQAAEKLKALSEKARKEKLGEAEKKQIAMNMGAAASKLGKSSSNSFSGDFSTASEALKNSDSEEFGAACQSIGDKLKRVGKARKMAKAADKLGECKASIGQCNVANIGGYAKNKGDEQNDKKGGLQAGTGTSDNPLGDPARLEEGYRQLIQVAGQAGEGPVETETEITEGQLSPSRLAIKNLHAEFEAAAEATIEKETIPLSRRFHVKRYFQTIRPKE